MTNTGFTIWFTGLSGAGKSTLSEVLIEAMRQPVVQLTQNL